MNIKSHNSQIRTLRKSNPHFMINDGFIVSPRAGFEISSKCPNEYKWILSECIDKGWLSPVAHLHERELIFIGLSKE